MSQDRLPGLTSIMQCTSSTDTPALSCYCRRPFILRKQRASTAFMRLSAFPDAAFIQTENRATFPATSAPRRHLVRFFIDLLALTWIHGDEKISVWVDVRRRRRYLSTYRTNPPVGGIHIFTYLVAECIPKNICYLKMEARLVVYFILLCFYCCSQK